MVGDDVAQTIELVPDESITDAIGRGHTLATAVADIIDNSLDAQAEDIRIRFLTEDDRLVAVRVRDDGIGMTMPALIDAMTLGRQKPRDDGALGHFGIGLKAASLSQALSLTVFSRRTDPCAMRIHRGSFRGEVLELAAAEEGYEWDSRGPATTGTVVEWRDIETISHSQIAAERRVWLERTITALAQSLGLTFHRIIQLRGVRITIDTWDLRSGKAGAPRTVEPRDPFQFTLSGRAGYPALMSAATSDGARLECECFILPPRSDSPSAWLLGKNPVEWQGIYVYRNDRLLQAGGWLEVRPEGKKLRLARMRIDLTQELERHLRLRHEKSGVTPTPEFIAALEAATNDAGTTLDSFRADAEEALRASNVRKSKVKPAVPARSGLPERVTEAVRTELGERDDDPIRIEWRMLPEGRLFLMLLERRRIVFNLGYKAALGGDGSALVQTLVYLLLESYFSKTWLGQGTRDQIDAWEKIASAAMLAQLDDGAFDALADWAPAPRPAPPPIELRWAHLGQRGDLALLDEPSTDIDAEEIAAALVDEVEGVAPGSDNGHLSPTSPGAPDDNAPEVEGELLVADLDGDETAEAGEHPSQRDIREIARTPALIGDREVVSLYRGGADIESIAIALGRDSREVAMRLCALLLDLEGQDIDDHGLAAMHGQAYTPDDRDRILEMYRSGLPVRRIAERYYRTPFAIGWQLLTSPKRPVEVPRTLLRRIDRALSVSAGAPPQGPGVDPTAG
jgi:hypothetical protein